MVEPTIWLTAHEHATGRSAATRRPYRTQGAGPLSSPPKNAPGARKRAEAKSARFGAVLAMPPVTSDDPPPGMAVSVSGWQSGLAIWHLVYWGSAIAAGLLLKGLIWR